MQLVFTLVGINFINALKIVLKKLTAFLTILRALISILRSSCVSAPRVCKRMGLDQRLFKNDYSAKLFSPDDFLLRI